MRFVPAYIVAALVALAGVDLLLSIARGHYPAPFGHGAQCVLTCNFWGWLP